MVKPGEPTQLAFVINSGTVRFFVDGQVFTELGIDDTYTKGAIDDLLTLGGVFNRHRELDGNFVGTIDELRISRVARYDAAYTPQNRPLVADEHTLALYHFDEGQGDVLKDSSSNDHHGKIVGAKWVRFGEIPTRNVPEIVTGDQNILQFNRVGDSVRIDGIDLASLDAFTHEFLISGRPTKPGVSTLEPAIVTIGNDQGGYWLNYFSGPFLRSYRMASNIFATKQYSGTDNTENTASMGTEDKPAHIAIVWNEGDIQLFSNGRSSLPEQLPPDFTNLIRETVKLRDASIWLGGRRTNEMDTAPSNLNMHAYQISSTARYTNDFQPPSSFKADSATVAIYHFDEGHGDILHDSSGNGHHGKIVGAKWVWSASLKLIHVL